MNLAVRSAACKMLRDAGMVEDPRDVRATARELKRRIGGLTNLNSYMACLRAGSTNLNSYMACLRAGSK